MYRFWTLSLSHEHTLDSSIFCLHTYASPLRARTASFGHRAGKAVTSPHGWASTALPLCSKLIRSAAPRWRWLLAFNTVSELGPTCPSQSRLLTSKRPCVPVQSSSRWAQPARRSTFSVRSSTPVPHAPVSTSLCVTHSTTFQHAALHTMWACTMSACLVGRFRAWAFQNECCIRCGPVRCGPVRCLSCWPFQNVGFAERVTGDSFVLLPCSTSSRGPVVQSPDT